MSGADGSVEIVWAGDERRFRVGVSELIAIQEARDCAPLELLARLAMGAWRVQDVTDVLRIALIGGGMDGKAARKLVEENTRPGHATEYGEEKMGELLVGAQTARAVLLVALHGVPDDPVGKEQAARETPGATRASPRPPSTKTAR